MHKLYIFLFVFLLASPIHVLAFEEKASFDTPIALQLAQVDSLQGLFSIISEATKKHSFETLLTYEANGFITTFKLDHHLVNNTSYQRLTFMDGPPRHVMRKQGLLGCANGKTRWGLWPHELQGDHLYQYEVEYRGRERIANRDTLVFDVRPKDDLRYGYRYSIDSDTGLVLKLITFEKETIIERMQTVSLDFLTAITEVSENRDSSYIWRVPEIEPCLTEQFQTSWKVGWLPKGFSFVANRVTSKGEQVLIFTDGLVSLSVFMLNESAKPPTKATARHGATVVVITRLSGAAKRGIAVVGEIPTATARRIAVSVSFN